MGVCGCVIPNTNCLCHSTPNYLVTMPKSVLDQIGKEHTEEVERLRQQNAELVKALRSIAGCGTAWFTARKIAKTAIAKATGGE